MFLRKGALLLCDQIKPHRIMRSIEFKKYLNKVEFNIPAKTAACWENIIHNPFEVAGIRGSLPVLYVPKTRNYYLASSFDIQLYKGAHSWEELAEPTLVLVAEIPAEVLGDEEPFC